MCHPKILQPDINYSEERCQRQGYNKRQDQIPLTMCSVIHPVPCFIPSISRIQWLHAYHSRLPQYEVFVTQCVALKSPRLCGRQLRFAILQFGFSPEDVTATSILSAGAMAMLLASVDTNNIRLVKRWHINSILIYLHTSAQTFRIGLAALMVQHGDYAIIPPTHEG